LLLFLGYFINFEIFGPTLKIKGQFVSFGNFEGSVCNFQKN